MQVDMPLNEETKDVRNISSLLVIQLVSHLIAYECAQIGIFNKITLAKNDV